MVLKPENSEEFQDEWIALIIFEYRNVGLIGVDLPGDGNVSISLEGEGVGLDQKTNKLRLILILSEKIRM